MIGARVGIACNGAVNFRHKPRQIAICDCAPAFNHDLNTRRLFLERACAAAHMMGIDGGDSGQVFEQCVTQNHHVPLGLARVVGAALAGSSGHR